MSSERKIGEWRRVSVNGGYRPELVRPTIRTNYGRINLRFVPCYSSAESGSSLVIADFKLLISFKTDDFRFFQSFLVIA